jgi:hypothetical protein
MTVHQQLVGLVVVKEHFIVQNVAHYVHMLIRLFLYQDLLNVKNAITFL